MKKIITLLFMLVSGLALSQTLDQKLLIIRNDGTVGGQLSVAYQVKGTGLPAANTLGSATVDVSFNNTKLTYVNASNWGFGIPQGYGSQVTNNSTSLRIGVTGSGVFPGGGAGFDVLSTYSTWVQLNFTILDSTVAPSLSIAPASNAIGLFKNHSNNPQTNVITNQTLSAPVLSVRSTISGNAGIAGAVLNYNDGGPLNVIADGTGAYSFTVPYGWSGYVLPVLTGYTFTPALIVYANVKADKTGQNYIASVILSVTIDQQLLVIRNDGTVGGQFNVAYQVKGTNLTTANTLGSATADVLFNNTKLNFLNATNWAFGVLQGYASQVTNNSTFIRVGVTSAGVFPGGAAGIDLTGSYNTWVTLNFTILDSTVAQVLSIAPGTNAIGLFQIHSNNPQTNIVSNQPLSAPVFSPLPIISGNTGTSGVTLSYTDGSAKFVVSDLSGAYSFSVSSGWSGTITPSKTGFVFNPVAKIYSNVLADQPAQNYVATPFVTVNVKVLLQGPYNGSGAMTTSLNTLGLIPLSSETAYASATYGYSVNNLITIPNSGIVDWIFIELRDSATTAKSTIIKKRAGFLLSNGMVVDTDGVSMLNFPATAVGNYYIIIRHRNHIAVMSAAPVPLNSATLLYDFTTAQSNAYGSNPMAALTGGVFGMISGDGNADGTVDYTNDIIAQWSPFFGLNGYYNGDYNLNGTVDYTGDILTSWAPNFGISGFVPAVQTSKGINFNTSKITK